MLKRQNSSNDSNGAPQKKKTKETVTHESCEEKVVTKAQTSQVEGTVEDFVFFYGKNSPFSQHYKASFSIDGQDFNCAEQYMMYAKAVVFKDDEMKKKILTSSNPVEQKKFGRQVKNFDKDTWNKEAETVVKDANHAKFSQNDALRQTLLATHPSTLVEASPRDRIWGIGMGASNPKAKDRTQWRGRNKLGFILTEVRNELMEKDLDDG